MPRGGQPEPNSPPRSLLSGVKAGQPALARALGLQRKASRVGFDWNDPRAVLRKIREEADEIEAALDRGDTREGAEETGDLLFVPGRIWPATSVPIRTALRSTNAKFERRFAYIERHVAANGRSLEDATLTRWTSCGTRRRRRSRKCSQARRPRACGNDDSDRVRHGVEAS